jgi:hypothetical protein
MADPAKGKGVGLLIGIGAPKPKAGEEAMSEAPMDDGSEGKRMAAAALRAALQGDDDMAIYDALAECVSYIDDDSGKEVEPEAELPEEV